MCIFISVMNPDEHRKRKKSFLSLIYHLAIPFIFQKDTINANMGNRISKKNNSTAIENTLPQSEGIANS